MSTEWRRKTYYNKRVLINTERILDPQFDDSVLCLTGAQLELVRNLMQYLHRRSTFASEYEKGYYLAPTNDEWDDLQAIVADLEETIMGCEEFTDLLEQVLACVCATAEGVQRDNYIGPGTQPAIDKYITDNGLQIEDDYGDDTVVDGERCAVAQLTYAAAWDFLTEVTVPLSDTLVDIILPASMMALAVMIGTTVLGIPVAIFVAVLGALIFMYTEGAEANVINEYFEFKEDLICALYNGLEINARAAEAEAMVVINKMEIGPTDKVLLHTMIAPWAIALAQTAHDNTTAWAVANVDAGVCDTCDEEEGTDWFAIRVPYPDGDVFIDHSVDAAYWEDAGVCGAMLNGETICGLVFEPIEGSGCVCKTSAVGPECDGANLTGSSGITLVNGQAYYWYKFGTHLEDEAIEALSPDADKYDELTQQAGPGLWEADFNLGFDCSGTRLVRVQWIVYEGSAP